MRHFHCTSFADTIFRLLIIIGLGSCAGTKIGQSLPLGNMAIPEERTFKYNNTAATRQEIIEYWSKGVLTDWMDGEKVDFKNPRTVLGCLLAGVRLEEVNQYLLKQKATGNNGSRWLLNPRGGYDFTAMALTPVVYLFDNKPNILYPATKKHLVEQILTIEGDGFTKKLPHTWFKDSENHILMAESARYLKNQWLRNNGNTLPKYNNLTNGVEDGLKNYLQEIYDYGMYEFNADPYLGYTYASLLNLNAFAKGEIQTLATKILDKINWQYALNSFQFKHFPPYRRRFKATLTREIYSDYHSVMLMVWAGMLTSDPQLSTSDLQLTNSNLRLTTNAQRAGASPAPTKNLITPEFPQLATYDSLLPTSNLRLPTSSDFPQGKHHALWAAMLPYKPSDKVMQWSLHKPQSYFVKMGHGFNSCPEICSGDAHYLLSSGGANQGRSSLIMPKPTVLFLEDNAKQLKATFHMYGPGKNFMQWNNTGVYQDFACTKGMVHIPKDKKPAIVAQGWQLFDIVQGTYLATFSQSELGLMVIVHASTATDALNNILALNPDKQLYLTQFNHPNGNVIEYDLNAPKNKWVITAVNKIPMDRQFDQWAFFEGNSNKP